MSEIAKTITFVVIGLLAIGIGVVTRPSTADYDASSRVGEDLTAKFSSPDDAKRLKIVRFDEDSATLSEFEVAEGEDGLWTIPSKDGYPADATRQMAEAAMSLKGREILDVVSQNPGDHEQYGVVDPLSPKLEPGQKGVGARVVLSDSNDNPLVDLIIGKKIKGSDGQRYVRESGRDVVYAIQIDPEKLSTEFDDWIEKDLLKLNPWDLKQVEIKDYSAELVAGMSPDGRFQTGIDWDRRAQMTLAYSDKDAKWEAVQLQSFDPQTGQYVDFALAEDEQLNTKSLDDLKTALDDLKIVDVVRKPQGLSDDLKAGEDFLKDIEAQRDLIMKGFTPASGERGGPAEIISSDGEVIATLNDGVEYVLRFGNLTSGPGGKPKEQSDDEQPPAKKASNNDVHRYLFVMARFNENVVERPKTEPLPELPTAEPASDAPAPAAEGDAAAGDEAATAPQESADGKAAEEDAEQPADNTPDDGKESAEPSTKATENATNSDGEKSESDDKQKEIERIIAERKRIEDENRRKLDAYQETLKKSREKVKELNLRFGDWYFIVDNDVFNKLRLGRNGVVSKKADKAENNDAQSPAGAPGSSLPGVPAIPGVGN